LLFGFSGDENNGASAVGNGVIASFLNSGSALSLHEVSKKDLNVGLSRNPFYSIILKLSKGAGHERSRV
jgi:hypothetical protein